ncbi:MAG: hypothetical protein ACI964_001412 [Spirosomataceae bacterium]
MQFKTETLLLSGQETASHPCEVGEVKSVPYYN